MSFSGTYLLSTTGELLGELTGGSNVNQALTVVLLQVVHLDNYGVQYYCSVMRQETPDVLHWVMRGLSGVGVVFTKPTRDTAVTWDSWQKGTFAEGAWGEGYFWSLVRVWPHVLDGLPGTTTFGRGTQNSRPPGPQSRGNIESHLRPLCQPIISFGWTQTGKPEDTGGRGCRIPLTWSRVSLPSTRGGQRTEVQDEQREPRTDNFGGKLKLSCLPTARSSHFENDFTYSGPGPKKNCKGCESPSNLGEFCTFHSLK